MFSNLVRAQMFQVEVLFNSMGHPIGAMDQDEQPHPVTKFELLPEEALYLIEAACSALSKMLLVTTL